MMSCFIQSCMYYSPVLSFYLKFLVIPYFVLTIISEPLCLKHHRKSLSKHVLDIIDGVVSSLVLYILCGYSRVDNHFYSGFIISMIVFCIANSYGPYKNFSITTSIFSKGPTRKTMILSIFWMILVIKSLSIVIENIKQFECMEISSLELSFVLASLACFVALDTDWSCYRLHIHHWALFYVLSLVFRPCIFSSIWSDFILGLFFGSFTHGVIMFGLDPIFEVGP